MKHTSYNELYKYGCDLLKKADIDDAALDARLLLEYVCKTDINDLYTHGDRDVSPEDEQSYEELIKERASNIPLQYITGVQDFMGLDFKVTKDVLVPRQDTEVLVEEAMKSLHDGMRVLDMCTGSGCILISLLHYSNDCSGIGIDISSAALSVARQNADRLGATGAEFIESNLFDNCPDERFDMIISNPPYIKTGVIKTLASEVKDHEPVQALDGSEDGLLFYRKIIEKAGDHLCGGGCLFFEIGYDQGVEVSEMMKQAGYSDVKTVKDYSGNDRVVHGYRSILHFPG